MSGRVCKFRKEDKFLYVQETSTGKVVILAKIWLFMENKPEISEDLLAYTCSALRACINLFLKEGDSVCQYGFIPIPDGVAYLTTKPISSWVATQGCTSAEIKSADELK